MANKNTKTQRRLEGGYSATPQPQQVKKVMLVRYGHKTRMITEEEMKAIEAQGR